MLKERLSLDFFAQMFNYQPGLAHVPETIQNVQAIQFLLVDRGFVSQKKNQIGGPNMVLVEHLSFLKCPKLSSLFM